MNREKSLLRRQWIGVRSFGLEIANRERGAAERELGCNLQLPKSEESSWKEGRKEVHPITDISS